MIYVTDVYNCKKIAKSCEISSRDDQLCADVATELAVTYEFTKYSQTITCTNYGPTTCKTSADV